MLVATAVLAKEPVYIGFDGAYGAKTNTAAKAIEMGARAAIDEINYAGGVLGGRPLELVTTDNQGISSRGRDNYVELASRKDMIAVLGGKYSPVSVEAIPDVQRMKVPFISVWGSADPITDLVKTDSYMFRLSLKDAWGVEALLRRAWRAHRATQICVLTPNTAWGRSGEAVLRQASPKIGVSLALIRWYNWGDTEFEGVLLDCEKAGAKALILIANEREGALVLNAMAHLPRERRMPVIAHWGISGGALHTLASDALGVIDLQVIQTFSFVRNPRPKARALARKLVAAQHLSGPEKIVSPVGVAHAYDMVYLLASAVNAARSTQGMKIRNALESLPPYEGVVRRYAPAFTPARHEALDRQQVLFVRMKPDGSIVPVN